jgi:ribonuclease BN (tRNA processing enzyme)
MHPTCFLIDGKIAVDAGALTKGLSLSEQMGVAHLLLSHSHIDHLYTLPFLLDNIFAELKAPVRIYGPEHTLESLRSHLFNNVLWPDFTTLSNERSPILVLQPLSAGETLEIEGIRITTAAMDHTVECFGYLLDDGRATAFIAGDTRSIDGALPLLEQARGLEIVILEASFPNRLARIAEPSRHLTPKTFAEEVKKLPKGIQVLATHMKPDCLGEIKNELADLALDNVALIQQGETYKVGAAVSRPSGNT